MSSHRIFCAFAVCVLCVFVASSFPLFASQENQNYDLFRQLIEENPREAIAKLEREIEENPSVEVYFLIAQAWSRVDANQSLTYLERIFSLAPRFIEAWKLWADIMTRAGQYQYATLRLEQQLKKNPDLVELRLMLAQFHVNNNRLARAESEFSRVVEEAPEGSEIKTRALYSLGYLYVASGRIKEGKRILEEVLERDSAFFPAMTTLGELLLKTGLLEEAEQLLKHARSIEPDNPDVLLLLGQYHVKKRAWAAARDVLSRLLENHPNHIKAHFFLAKAYKGEGKSEEAVEHFEAFRRLQEEELSERVSRQEGLAVRGAR